MRESGGPAGAFRFASRSPPPLWDESSTGSPVVTGSTVPAVVTGSTVPAVATGSTAPAASILVPATYLLASPSRASSPGLALTGPDTPP